MSQTEVQLIKSSSVVDGDIVGMSSSKLSGTLPAVSAANLTNIPAANLTGTLPAISGANLTGITAGITMADQWRLSSNFSNDGANLINANWERVDNTNWSGIGSSMTESSGIFSFPTTGIYLIELTARGTASGAARQYAGAFIQTGVSSTYTNVADSYGNCAANSYYFNTKCSTIFDVTNTTTHTVRFYAESAAACSYSGNTNQNQTFVTFLRLGDT